MAVFDALQADLDRLQAAVAEAQAARVSFVTAEEMAALRAAAATSSMTDEQIQLLLGRAIQGSLPWPAVLECISSAASSRLTLTSVRQEQDRLTIQGAVDDQPAILAFMDRLRASALFDDVGLLSQAGASTNGPISFVVSLRLRGYAR